jgi:casein kinase 1
MNYLHGGKGIVTMQSSGKLADGRHYLVMEMLGPSLGDITEILKESEVKKLGTDMLDIIQSMHLKGMVHRDIKPDNFLFSKDGTLRIADYGFCKLYRCGDGSHKPLSDRGTPVGSPMYMSIDVHRGRDVGRKDDLESLCYVLLSLLNGVLPWRRVIDEGRSSNISCVKEGMSPRDIAGTAVWLGSMLKYIRELSYDSDPNYALVRQFLEQHSS